MGDPDTSGPETDQEEWSEDTLPSSPQHAGYQPLDHYQALEDDEQQEEQQEQEQEQQPEDDSTDEPLAGGDGNSRQQPDIAAAMLRAMEADYRACVESEERLASNGPVAPSSTSVPNAVENLTQDDAQVEANGAISQERDGALPDGELGGSESLGEIPPPRPVSPLGQDQAERVMRAMQGFALAAPDLPPARFEVDWGSPDALANLAAPTAGAARTVSAAAPPAPPTRRSGVEEKEREGEAVRQGANPPNEDRR